MEMALRVQKESTLKAVLSALWNLSAHSNQNKVCSVYVLFFVVLIFLFSSYSVILNHSLGGHLQCKWRHRIFSEDVELSSSVRNSGDR